MDYIKILLGFISLIILSISCKKTDTNNINVLNDADNIFIIKSAIYDSAEIRTAQLALVKTTDSVIMSYAQYMLAEHITTRNDLKVMGTVVGFSINDSINAANLVVINQLQNLSGREFDSSYIHSRLDGKAETENFFIEAINNGNQKNLKSYESSNLERIRLQYIRADSIAQAFY